MDNLYLPAQIDTPEVNFDVEKLQFIIKGKCHPENVKAFIDPLLDWIDVYSLKPNEEIPKIHLQLLFTYLNSASLKYLLVFIQRLVKLCERGVETRITWYYEADDEDMKETGTEFFELTNIDIPFEIIQYTNQI